MMMETETPPLKTESRWKRRGSLLKQAIAGSEQDYTHGSIDRAIVLLAIPMILEMAMESLFAVVDMFFVANLGVAAVATVGATESVLTLIYALGIGLSSAATAMVARRVGEGKRKAASFAAGQTILIAIVLSVLIAVPGYYYADDILHLMIKDPAVAEYGAPFTRLMFVANLPILLLWMLNGVFRGAGDAATAMRALWIANGVNILLVPLFIYGWGPVPGMGLLGAAVATTAGRSIGVAYQLWHLFRPGKIIHIRRAYMRVQTEIITRLLKLAAGGTGQYLISSASWIFLMYILGQIGKDVQAGYTIAIRIMIFSILPCWGMANAASTLVGQNLGAGFPDRAEKSAWRAAFFNMVFMGMIGLCYAFFSHALIGMFTDEPAVINAGALALRIMASGYLFYGSGMVIAQSINGAGDTRTPTILNFIFFWLVEIPLAAFLALWLDWGQTGVYWSIVIAESGMALAAIWVFRQGKWKTTRI